MTKRKKKRAPKLAQVTARTTNIEIALAKVQNPNWRPDLDGQAGVPREVDSPLNVRESAVETLFARGVLTKLQKKSADMFRAYYEAFSAETVSALDYSRDHVDGSAVVAPVTQQRIRARRELANCRAEVGRRPYALLVSVCGQGSAFTDLYPITGKDKEADAANQRRRLTAADILRDALYDIGIMWGLATGHSQPKRGQSRRITSISLDNR